MARCRSSGSLPTAAGRPTGSDVELMMRSSAYALIVLTALFAGSAAVAQTPLTRADKRVLRQQDEQECLRQAAAQNITRRNRAEFLRTCMADRQGERKTAEKKEASDQR